ncbi:hypothetical protein FB107DRAFT_271207 [Schizophyllum commune]
MASSHAPDVPSWDDSALWTNTLAGNKAGLRDFGAFMIDMDAPVMDMNPPTMDVAEPARDIAAPMLSLAAPAKDMHAPTMDFSRHPNMDFPLPAQLADHANESACTPPHAMPPPRRAVPPPPGRSPHSCGPHGGRSSRDLDPRPSQSVKYGSPPSVNPPPSCSKNP